MADQRDRRTGVEGEVEVLEHGPPFEVLEGDVLEADLTGAGRQLDRGGLVRDLLGLVEHLEDPLARRRRALRLADPHPERAERGDEHPEQKLKITKSPTRACRRRPCERRTSSTAAWARRGMKERSGTYVARCRFA